MHVRFLDDCRERPLGLPTRLKERGEVTSVADPRYLQLHRPHPRVPGTLAVAVALPHASGTALVTPSSYVLLDLHLHEGLGEHPHALLEEVRVLIDHRLAQQLREPYPQLIGHRVLRFGRLVSSEGTTRWPSSSTARSLFTHSRGHYPSRRRFTIYWNLFGDLGSTPQLVEKPRWRPLSPPIGYQTRRFWGFPSPIPGRSPLDIDFFNTLTPSTHSSGE